MTQKIKPVSIFPVENEDEAWLCFPWYEERPQFAGAGAELALWVEMSSKSNVLFSSDWLTELKSNSKLELMIGRKTEEW